MIGCSLLAVLMNPACILALRFWREREKPPHPRTTSVFMTNLMISNSITGIYSAIVSVADELYRGQYVLWERVWITSTTCKAAEFLFLMSTNVSSMLVVLLLLQNFILSYFVKKPFTTKKVATTSVILAWFQGIVLAALPLFPANSH